MCGSGLGTFIFSPLVDKLIEEYNWRGAMLIIAALVFNCILFGALFRPLTPTTKQSAVTDGTVQESSMYINKASKLKFYYEALINF